MQKGRRFLVFGGMSEKEGCYDWLPYKVKYVHEYFNSPIRTNKEADYCGLTEDFDESGIECDGYFTDFEGSCIVSTEDDRCIMIEKKYGEGCFIMTSIHELPSKNFLHKICSGDSEIIF